MRYTMAMLARARAVHLLVFATMAAAAWCPALPAYAHGEVVVITLFFIAFGVLPAAGVSIVAGLKLLPRRRHAVFVGAQCAMAALVIAAMTLFPLGDDIPWLHVLALSVVAAPLAAMLWLENRPRDALIALVASVVGTPLVAFALLFLLTAW